MKRIVQWLLVGVALVALTACGGGGTTPNDEGGESATDTTPPTFTSSATVTVPENQTDALTLQATDESLPISYAISGGDSAEFNVDSSTGKVTFKVAPDFEVRDSYSFTAEATDAVGNTATQSVVVHIGDMPENTIKKTGQTKSYDENGTVVTDGSVKDDGYYQTGVAPSYTRDDDNNIVIDHVTGLMWQDDANVSTVTKPWLTQTNYDICTGSNGQTQDTSKCYDTGGDTAATYCANLTLGGYTDWRLPTDKELESIVDYGRIGPAIDTTYFKNVRSDYYWSSTTTAGFEYNAWIVYFNYGYVHDDLKDLSLYVRCVRAGQ